MKRMFPAVVAMGLACQGWGADWPQFLGPERSGVSRETAIHTDWSTRPPRLVWKANVFVGASSVAVVGGRLYTMGNNRSKDTVQCLDAATGKVLWSQAYRCKMQSRSFDGGTASTPTVEGGRVFTLSYLGQLHCWDAQTGAPAWEVDLVAEYGGRQGKWGWSESPLVAGNLLIVQPFGEGASRVALDKTTGRLVWKQGNDKAGYASPVSCLVGGTPAVAFFNASGLVGAALEDGHELFRQEWVTDFDVNASTPLFADGAFFLSSGYGRGCAVIEVGAGAPRERWRNSNLSLHLQNPVLLDGHLYAVSGDNRGVTGTLKCLDFATGQEKWAEKMGETYGQILQVAGKLIVLTDKGEVVLVDPSPSGYRELGRFQALGGARSWAVPALADGLLYCRQNLGDLACFDLRP